MKCPYTSFKKECIKEDCPKWTTLKGTDPQTGHDFDREGCSDAFLPILLVEVSRNLQSIYGVVESHRNTADKNLVKLGRTLAGAAQLAHARRSATLE